MLEGLLGHGDREDEGGWVLWESMVSPEIFGGVNPRDS